MRREAKLLIFLMSNILYKGIETLIEQQRGLRQSPCRTPMRTGMAGVVSSIFISYNGCVEVFIMTGY